MMKSAEEAQIVRDIVESLMQRDSDDVYMVGEAEEA